MSDYEDELDDSLGVPDRNLRDVQFSAELNKYSPAFWQSQDRYDPFGGPPSRQYRWRASILDASPIEGRMVIPGDVTGDTAVMKAFGIVFDSVTVKHEGMDTFLAMIGGRSLGRFRIAPEPLVAGLDGPVRGKYTRDMKASAMGWLRTNMKFELLSSPEEFPPYTPRLPKSSKGTPIAEAAKDWAAGMRGMRKTLKPAKTQDAWVPLTEGEDLSRSGVSLSASSGTGMTNMAFATQMEQTSRASVRAAPLVQMHLEGKVIG